VFGETTGALVPYYAERGILVTVNADQPPDAVTAEIKERLALAWVAPPGRASSEPGDSRRGAPS
jgi:hypothetical protein